MAMRVVEGIIEDGLGEPRGNLPILFKPNKGQEGKKRIQTDPNGFFSTKLLSSQAYTLLIPPDGEIEFDLPSGDASVSLYELLEQADGAGAQLFALSGGPFLKPDGSADTEACFQFALLNSMMFDSGEFALSASFDVPVDQQGKLSINLLCGGLYQIQFPNGEQATIEVPDSESGQLDDLLMNSSTSTVEQELIVDIVRQVLNDLLTNGGLITDAAIIALQQENAEIRSLLQQKDVELANMRSDFNSALNVVNEENLQLRLQLNALLSSSSAIQLANEAIWRQDGTGATVEADPSLWSAYSPNAMLRGHIEPYWYANEAQELETFDLTITLSRSVRIICVKVEFYENYWANSFILTVGADTVGSSSIEGKTMIAFNNSFDLTNEIKISFTGRNKEHVVIEQVEVLI